MTWCRTAVSTELEIPQSWTQLSIWWICQPASPEWGSEDCSCSRSTSSMLCSGSWLPRPGSPMTLPTSHLGPQKIITADSPHSTITTLQKYPQQVPHHEQMNTKGGGPLFVLLHFGAWNSIIAPLQLRYCYILDCVMRRICCITRMGVYIYLGWKVV